MTTLAGTMPALKCEIAFATGTNADPGVAGATWTDVSSYVRAATTKRGRQRDLGRVEAGTATVVLDNRDRRFEGEYASSPYYPNLRPLNQIRLVAGYVGEVLVDKPTAYFRIGDQTGLVMADLLRLNAGSYSAAGVTLGVAGAVTGRFGALFNGSTGYASHLTAPAFNCTVSSWTVEFWIKPTALGNVTLYNQNAANGFTISLTSTGQISYTGPATLTTTAAGITTGTWWHVVVVGAAGNLKIYINGVQRANATTTQPTNATFAGYVGATAGTSLFFSGAVDELAIYSGVALSAARVLAHFNEQQKLVSDGFIFTGYTDGWPPSYPGQKDAVVTVGCTDAFKVFANTPLPKSVWAYQMQQLVTAGTVYLWARLNDVSALVPPVDSGPSSFQLNNVGTPQYAQSGLLKYGPETGCSFSNAQAGVTPVLPTTRVGDPVAGMGTYTVEALIRMSSGGGGTIWDQSGSRYQYKIAAAPTTNGLSGGGTDASTGVSTWAVTGGLGGAVNLGDGLPHHIMVVVTGTAVAAYVDGLACTVTGNMGFTGQDTAAFMAIGNSYVGRSSPGTANFIGTLQEVAVYKSGLTAGDATTHSGWALTPRNGETSDARIAYGASIVIPTTLQNLSVGVSALNPASLGTDLLSFLQNIRDTEEGLLCIDTNGQLLFYNRDQPYISPGNVSQQTLGDGGSGQAAELPYVKYDPQFDEVYVITQVTAQAAGSAVQVDATTAQATYGIRGESLTSLLHPTQLEVLDHANWLLYRQSAAHVEIRSVTVAPQTMSNPQYAYLTDSLWTLALVRQLGDLITVKRRPPGGGSASSFPVRIVGISHTITPSTWTTDFQTARFADQYWILGDATYGVLDSTTIPGF